MPNEIISVKSKSLTSLTNIVPTCSSLQAMSGIGEIMDLSEKNAVRNKNSTESTQIITMFKITVRNCFQISFFTRDDT